MQKWNHMNTKPLKHHVTCCKNSSFEIIGRQIYVHPRSLRYVQVHMSL